MTRPIRRPHASRRLRAVVLFAALGSLTVACAAPASPPGTPAPAVPATRSAARTAAVSYDMPADITSLVLPTTGEDTRWTQGLDALGSLAAAWEADGCARDLGQSLPDSPPPMFTRYRALPDLTHLAAHGFAADNLVPGAPTAPRPGADAPARPGPELRTCLSRGRAVGQELVEVYGPLQSAWFTEVATIDRTPEVRAAFAGLGDCLTAHRVDAADESAFFDLVDQRLQAADDTAARGLGKVYATCMKPVEAVRQPLRARAASRFRASHSAEITTVRARLPGKIADLEKRYRIRISFPKP
ncbi:hypothetical protein [Streptomyces sp. NPDC097619]|uniref:hypothetical protein n=1 Tax=Streptomyces sp. NPDC097619 TaxID=3157228 RepID=UPI0033315F44